MAPESSSELADMNQDGSGINEPGSQKPERPIRTPFFKDLLSRRVPQILGGYLAGSWIIFEFVQWLVGHYTISPYLEEFCLIALASLIPTVFLLAYYHGRPGKDRWTQVEKIGIPTNLAATTLLLFFLFQGRDLGATTTSVSVTDETGQKIQRVIPKSEFRKKVAIFSLENETGDTTYDWMMHAIPDMLKLDLIQDMYLDIESTYDFYKDIRDEGFIYAVGIPLILKKKISEQQYMEYFIAGSIGQLDGQLSVMVALHETKTTKSLAENSLMGMEILEIVDEMSMWIKEVLSLPAQHLESTVDLPASEILTKSDQALKTFYQGMNACYINENWKKGMTLLEQSVQLDSTFAYAYWEVLNANLKNIRGEEGMLAFLPLMKHSYKLPEKLRIELDFLYWFVAERKTDMALKVVKNWIELYPEDVNAYELLADCYSILMQTEDVIKTYEKILKLDPTRYDFLLYIAQEYNYAGNFEEAVKYYQLYADEFPNSSTTYIELGKLYAWYGKHEQAKSYYEKALLIEPADISVQLLLADNKAEMGNFNSALHDLDDILDRCNSPQERVEVYTSLENHYFIRGQANKAIKYVELKLAEQEKYDPQIEILYTRFFSLERYILAGRVSTAFQIAREMEKTLEPPQDFYTPFAYYRIYLELEDVENTEEYLEKFEATIEERQIEALRPQATFARGKLYELEGDYETAIQQFKINIELATVNPHMDFHIGLCYRKNKQYRKAEEHFQKIIDLHPFWPEELYEFGLVYYEWGKYDKALEYFNRAQSIWENADPEYKPAALLREKLSELEASVP